MLGLGWWNGEMDKVVMVVARVWNVGGWGDGV